MNYSIKMLPKNHMVADIKLARRLRIPLLDVVIMKRNGITNTEDMIKFLSPSLDDIKADIYLRGNKQIHDMRKGCNLISDAIRKQWKITIYSDYDVDGITSNSIMYTLLKRLGAKHVDPFCPSRAKDGYGPNMNEYKRIADNGTKLLITTDNGIAGKKEVDYIRKRGVKVIITDHHEWNMKAVPNANAIIMPNCPFDKFHFDGFCGAGIAFMIACYMLKQVPTDLLDLACLGTVADSVPLLDEDRDIVALGLKQIRHTKRLGLKVLAKVADIDLAHITAKKLSFNVIPLLNSLGRLSNANIGRKLLLTTDKATAEKLATYTYKCNEERKAIMDKELPKVIKQATSNGNRKRKTLVLYSKYYHPQVVGIEASRVTEITNKPTIIIGHLASDPVNIYRGSGRSVNGFNLFNAMNPLRPYMVSFGGHEMACGLTIKRNKIRKLRNCFEKNSKHQKISNPLVKSDWTLTKNLINWRAMNALEILQPFGNGNAEPNFHFIFKNIYNVKTIGNGKHMSFTLDPSKRSLHAVAFNAGKLAKNFAKNNKNVEVTGMIETNYYKGNVSLQLIVTSIRHTKVNAEKYVMVKA